jgi:hypothetical protein
MVVLTKPNTCTYVKQKFSAGNRINRKKKMYQGAKELKINIKMPTAVAVWPMPPF